MTPWRGGSTQYASLTGEAEPLPKHEVFEAWRRHVGEGTPLRTTDAWAQHRWGLRLERLLTSTVSISSLLIVLRVRM